MVEWEILQRGDAIVGGGGEGDRFGEGSLLLLLKRHGRRCAQGCGGGTVCELAMGVCVDESISTSKASLSSGGYKCNLGGFSASSSKEFVMSLVRGMCHDIK